MERRYHITAATGIRLHGLLFTSNMEAYVPYFPAMYVWQLWLEKVSYSDTDTWQPHAYSHLHFHVFISEGSLTFLSLAVIMG